MGELTLLKVILGLYCPKIVRCIMKNKNVAIMNYEGRRPTFSFIPSKTQLFNQTSRWDIESGMDISESNEIERISQSFKMSDEVNRFIDENANNLSEGQAQRVNLARGLVHKVDILIADEPTASLDNKIGNTVIYEITSPNSTIIVMTHNKEQLKFFDKIIIMNNGIIVADLDKGKLNINEYYKEWLGFLWWKNLV